MHRVPTRLLLPRSPSVPGPVTVPPLPDPFPLRRSRLRVRLGPRPLTALVPYPRPPLIMCGATVRQGCPACHLKLWYL